MTDQDRDPLPNNAADRLHVRILVPSRVFQDCSRIASLVVPTRSGSMGFLPHRLDCVAAVVPGILDLDAGNGERWSVAVDEGILVKSGLEVLVAVRHALGGKGHETLRDALAAEFGGIVESEHDLRVALAKMEGSFLHRLSELSRG